jgi:O-antigen ligase
MGHFHSTPLQLLVERGLPALLLWLWIFGVYLRILWRGLKIQDSKFKIQDSKFKIQDSDDPRSAIRDPHLFKGIVLGCFGGAIGFFTSGLVHYNFGDQEVAMIFYMLMGLSVFICNFKK